MEYATVSPKSLNDLEEQFFLIDNPHYRIKPASVRDFVLDNRYLGLDDVYDNVLVECEKILNGGYTEVVDYEGIGAGKTYKGQILLLYKCHQLLCLHNAHQYLGISRDKYITLLNMGLTLQQAKGVFFEGMKSMIAESPFFKQFGMQVFQTEIRFNQDKIKLVCGSSSKTIALGLNVFAAIMDEPAFYNETIRARKATTAHEAQDQAENLYTQIKRRITSRFKIMKDVKPMIAMLSSPKHEEDFMNEKIKEKESLGLKNVYVINNPTWKAKDRHKMSEEVFVFDRESFGILTAEQMQNYYIGKEKLDITPSEDQARLLKYGSKLLDQRLWIIPVDFKDDFIKSPELCSRDYGAVPTSTIERFFRRPEQIEFCMYPQIKNRWNGTFDDVDISNPPNEKVFIHVDLGLNRVRADGSRGDFAGLAVCHFGGYDQEHGGRPIVVFDLVARVTAGNKKEIEFSDVREFILALLKNKWKIYKVTYDSWQSLDSIQTLRKKGVVCDILSMDKTSEPHETLKAGIYEHRIMLPEYEPLHTELKQLERVATTDKIDHPRYGSKDVADAVAGSCFNCVKLFGTKPGRGNRANTQTDNPREIGESFEKHGT